MRRCHPRKGEEMTDKLLPRGSANYCPTCGKPRVHTLFRSRLTKLALISGIVGCAIKAIRDVRRLPNYNELGTETLGHRCNVWVPVEEPHGTHIGVGIHWGYTNRPWGDA
jgi:hypothetical protein